ncbi:MAG: NAD(P)-dependent oxidoreductase, partial [Nitrososphaerales archaeon]
LSVKTKGLIDRSKLGQMKEDCILVNVARAAIVVEEDLYDHLKAHPTFRAGFDVWWEGPKKGHAFAERFPFLELENFLGTPHVAGDVVESIDLASNSLVDNVIRYLDNRPLKGVANRDDYLGLKGLS